MILNERYARPLEDPESASSRPRSVIQRSQGMKRKTSESESLRRCSHRPSVYVLLNERGNLPVKLRASPARKVFSRRVASERHLRRALGLGEFILFLRTTGPLSRTHRMADAITQLRDRIPNTALHFRGLLGGISPVPFLDRS